MNHCKWILISICLFSCDVFATSGLNFRAILVLWYMFISALFVLLFLISFFVIVIKNRSLELHSQIRILFILLFVFSGISFFVVFNSMSNCLFNPDLEECARSGVDHTSSIKILCYNILVVLVSGLGWLSVRSIFKTKS